MGSLVAALLSSQAEINKDEIWLVGKPSSRDHFRVIQSSGLILNLSPQVFSAVAHFPIKAQKGKFTFKNIKVTQNPEEVYPADLVIILVKTYRTLEAAQSAKALVAPEGVILTLQNGLGNREIIEEIMGGKQSFQGITSLGATFLKAGSILWTGFGNLDLGLNINASLCQRQILEKFAGSLYSFGLKVNFVANIESLIWGKLVINCAINPLAAILKVPNGELLAIPEALEIMEAAALEAGEVAKRAGITLPYSYEAGPSQAREVARLTSANINSMLSDILKGRPTEIEAINGAVVREGKRVGYPTPANQTLAGLVKALSTRANSPGLKENLD